ncbi:MAG: antitoxin VapB family protein [Promethearchaeota archaeon]
MPYKTVSLNEKAYSLLKKAKKEGESFSDTVIRVLNKPDYSKFLSLAGSLKGEVTDLEIDEFIKEAKSAWK